MSANYNRPMYCTSPTDSAPGGTLRGGPGYGADAADSSQVALAPLATTDRRIEYCLRLANSNMSPYLARRGQVFDDAGWRNLAPQARFFLIVEMPSGAPVGFLSVRDIPEAPEVLHIGDIQIEPAHHRRGIGAAVLRQAERLARSRQRSAMTLNVFRDNPALRLYQRLGYQRIDTDVLMGKYKMRKALRSIVREDD